MILQVHDELVFDAYSTEVESLRELVKAEMESAFVLKVPLVADTGVGRTWLQAH
jgi:DNA polymerase-1